MKRTYPPNCGSRVPSYLRDALLDWLEAGADFSAPAMVDDEPRPITWLFGRLWNCTDTLPGWVVQATDALPWTARPGATYASAVRMLKEQMRQAAA